jgi:hypothetical protein
MLSRSTDIMVYCIEDIRVTPFFNGQSKLMASKFQNISSLGLISDVITKINSRPNSMTQYILLAGLSITTAQCQTYDKEHELS